MRLHRRIKKKLPRILKLLRAQELGPYLISKKVGVAYSTVKRIADEYEIEIVDNRSQPERNKEIVNRLLSEDIGYPELAKEYGVTVQRIQQIASEANIRLHDHNHNKKHAIIAMMLEDSKIMTYAQIRKKYQNNRGFAWDTLTNKFTEVYGITLKQMMRNRRNNTIVSKYASGEIANQVVKGKEHELNSPLRIKRGGYVYKISSSAGFKKCPKIKSRAAGGINERRKILNLIVKLREEKEMSFRAIADHLNKKGLKTVTGISFTDANVNLKYRSFRVEKKKVRQLKHF